MTCCGKNRAWTPFTTGTTTSPAQTTGDQRFTAFCEYTGHAALIVIGPVSGRIYRFNYRGARLPIDLRDRPSLGQISQLRIVDHR